MVKKLEKAIFIKTRKYMKQKTLILIMYQFLKKNNTEKKNSFKYFIEYNDNEIIRPLCIRLPQMTGYAKKFNENIAMSFRVNDKQFFKNYNAMWEKIEKLICLW